MFQTFFSSLAMLCHIVGAAFFGIGLSIAAFFGYQEPSTVISPPVPLIRIATSSSSIASTTNSTLASTTVPIPTEIPQTPVKAPSRPIKAVPPIVPPLIQPNLPVSTSTETRTVGTTTIAIQSVPLLFGETVHAGESIPIAYLQMTNIGSQGALLKGFWIKQNGSAPTEVLIGLSTIDDKGGLVGSIGGAILFKNGLALAPTDAYFAPGQMRLFTVKITMTQNISPYIGMQLMIDVMGIETAAVVRDPFPIRGTTWTIAQ